MKFFCAALALGLSLSGGWLCRYTIRDLGFVDLRGPVHRLVVPQSGDEALPADFETKLSEGLRFSNLKFEFRAPEEEGDRTPFLILEHGTRVPLAVPEREVDSLLQAALRSPIRNRLVEQSLDSFAFLLFLPGEDSKQVAEARHQVDQALERLEEWKSQLPRPIQRPIRKLEIPPEQRSQERVLLASLGLNPEPTANSALAVVYGRGKLAGPALEGKAIQSREVLTQLVLVGESCECDTDRDWLGTQQIPMLWPPEQRRRAWQVLGFDPESPMVKAEVARILAHDRERPKDGKAADRSWESLLFGYRETTVDRVSSPGAETSATSSEPSSLPVPLEITEAGEGDWDFEDDEAETEPAGVESEQEPPANPLMQYLLAALTLVLGSLGIAWIMTRRKPNS
ncbi:MAG: hypothetical protein DWQ01_11060 [Planctomycetota bacterium]|nr:MAG: hypothetical protein DWQ01_11060 [Planctomycetota bacterium]